MSNSLLEKARKVPSHKKTVPKVSQEDIDLLVAFIRGEVNQKQVKVVLGFPPNGWQFYAWFTKTMLLALDIGIVKIKKGI